MISLSGRTLALLLLIVTTFLPQVPAADPVGAGPRPDKPGRLDIPDTGQEKRRPESGWCGEAAIQMALSHYGAYASQKAINRAGKPEHPDLYSNEMPAAMEALGLEIKPWEGRGLRPFIQWVRGQLAEGRPVVLGVKIYPTEHPEWELDHFVLAVGSTKVSLTLNTTWNRQETRSFELLSSREKGLSFANRSGDYFGYAITGFNSKSAPAGSKPTRIRIVRRGDNEVELHVAAENLERGRRYHLVKFTDLAAAGQPGAKGEVLRSFAADGPKAEIVEKVHLDDARVYRCVAEGAEHRREGPVNSPGE